MATLSVRTKKVKFGPMVTPVGFRNPAVLARMACTVHSISNGRLQLGIGAGWYKDEYDAHGIPFPGFAARKRQLREALVIVSSLVRGKKVDLDGKYFSAHTECLPKPKSRMNLIVGGRSRGTVALASEFADEWNFFGPTKETFMPLRKFIEAASRKIVISQTGPFILGEDNRDLEAKLRKWAARRGVEKDVSVFKRELRRFGVILGTPEEFVSELQERREWGIEKFYLQLADPTAKSSAGLLTDVLRRGV